MYTPLDDESLSIYDVPPSSKDSEESVIHAILQDKHAIYEISRILKPEYFTIQRYRIVYEACVDLYLEGIDIDVISISEWIRDKELQHHRLERSDIMDFYMHDLKTASQGVYFARRVLDFAKRRAVWESGFKAIESSSNLQDSLYTENAIKRLIDDSARFSGIDANSGVCPVETAFQTMENEITNGVLPGITTGFHRLDLKTHGLMPGHMILVAARSNGGKSAFALTVCDNLVRRHKRPIIYFSLEMTATDIAKRRLCLRAEDPKSIQSLQAIRQSVIDDNPLWIVDDASGLSFADIQARTLQYLHRSPDACLVVIDHIGIVKIDERRNSNRAHELGLVSTAIKDMAKRHNLPVMVLSQLNRQFAARPNKKINVADIRDSGRLHEDSDVTILIELEENEDETPSGNGKLYLSKNRHGSKGAIDIRFMQDRVRICEKIL